MKLEQIKSDKFEKLIKHYEEKKLHQLQSIIPKWEYSNDSDKMLDRTLHPKAEEYVIFLVNTDELIKMSELYEVNPEIMFTGDKLNDGRVATILNRWENNEFVDPPTVEIFDAAKRRLAFSDGRHRSKTAYLLGHKQC